MNQSPELRDLVLRTYDAVASGDASFFDRHLAHQEGVLIIGTDPNEWWTDPDTITRVFKAQVREMGGLRVVGSDPQAYSTDTVGWVADRPTFRLPDGTDIPLRNTLVFVKEAGDWKLIHQHLSIGVPNQAAVGQDLPLG